MTAEERWFRSSFLPIIPIIAFLSSVFVVVGICFGDMRPLITVVVFAGIFAAFYFYAKRPGTVIGYPDGPIWSFREARDEAAGARMIIIPRDRCQFKGCGGKVSLSQCEHCDRTYCPQHVKEHDCNWLLHAQIVGLEEVWRKWPSEDVASVPACFRIFKGESVMIPVAGRTLFPTIFSELLGPPIPEASSLSLVNSTVLVQEQDMA